MLRLHSPATLVVLAAATALGPLATDLYLPAMPAIGRAFGVGADQVQLTLSLYMLGFALAQLMVGPLSDRYGRKPVLLGGFALFALASAGCMLAPSIEALQLGRFLQALGGATGPVLARAAIRDLYEPEEAARRLAYMALAMGVAPAVAPVLGGLLLSAYGWSATFAALVVYALGLALVLGLTLPEPLPADRRQSVAPASILRNYRILLGRRDFIGYTLTNAAAFSGLFAFLSGSSFVLIDLLGVPEQRYGWYFSLIVAGYMCGSLLSGRCSRRLGMSRLILLGTLLTAVAGAAMALLAWQQVYSVWAVILPHAVFMIGVGTLMPQTMAGAIGPFPQMAGSASALFGFVQMTIAAAAGAAVGQLHDGTPLPMAALVAAAGAAALVAYLLLVRSRPDAAAYRLEAAREST